jgi:hypothetical protein
VRFVDLRPPTQLLEHAERVRYVNRPSRHRGAVIERQCKNAMMWTGRIGDGGVEIDRLGGQVDYRSAGDAKGIDVAASESGARYRLAERTGPNLAARDRVQGVDVVVFSRDQQPARGRPGRAPKERLCIDMSDDLGPECLVKVHQSRAFPSQAGHREVAAAISTTMIGQDVVLGLASSRARGGRGNLPGFARARPTRLNYFSVRGE